MTDYNTQLQQENAQLRNERDLLKRQCDLYSEIITEQQARISAIEAWARTNFPTMDWRYGKYEHTGYAEAQQAVMNILHPKVSE